MAYYIILSGVFLYATLSTFLPEVILRKRFKEREKLTDEKLLELFKQYTDASDDLIIDLLLDISRGFQVPRGLLRPTDQFEKEFCQVKYFPLVSINENFQPIYEARLEDCGRLDEFYESLPNTIIEYINFFVVKGD